MHTGLHAGKAPPGVKGESVDQPTDEPADDEENVCVCGVDVRLEVSRQGRQYRLLLGQGALIS